MRLSKRNSRQGDGNWRHRNKIQFWLPVFIFILAAFQGEITKAAPAEAAHAAHGMVASVNSTATAAGVTVLKDGGNAIDAAVAVALTLGVVDGDNSGIGGGCFMLIRLADGSTVAIDGREMAPAAATRDMYLRRGTADVQLSQTGPLASGVPGSLAAYDYAIKKFGRKKLSALLLPAATLAADGFLVDDYYAGKVNSAAKELGKFESSRAVFFHADGKPIHQGDVFKQLDLAATYRQIAQHGADWFYNGPFGAAVEDWMRKNGGIMTARDLQNYHIVVRDPIVTTYREYQIVSFPPPSSGGVHVAEMLNVLEHFDIKAMDPVTRLHVIAETMKLAFADRAYWLGDPDYAPVPRGLVDKTYAEEQAKKISLDHVTKVPAHGVPADAQNNIFKKHTTHFSVADDQGNWVACTATVNTTFGSKVVIPGTGVVMNNQMDDFSIQPGVANYFGLIGAEANAIAPGKRPLSSMSPTIVLEQNRPILALGAAGGPTIISQVLQELVNILDLGLTPEAAIAEARIHQQWSPDELAVEKSLAPALQAGLKKRGHKLIIKKAMGVSQIVAAEADGKGFVGTADPRAPGKAAGW